MMRRRHKKSRKGCLECKKRHIKCDETRPRCINCATVDRECQYSTPTAPSGDTPGRSPSASGSVGTSPQPPGGPGPSGPYSAAGGPGFSTNPVSAPFPAPGPAPVLLLPAHDLGDYYQHHQHQPLNSKVDLVHMQLFHHYLISHTDIYPFVMGDLHNIIVKMALFGSEHERPFLMHSLLALSARHLSSVSSGDQGRYYHDLAIQLQTEALTLFNSFDVDYFAQSMERRLPAFMFSAIIGFHALCDMLSYRDDDFGVALKRFTEYLRLHRGIISVMDGYWEDLKRTELGIVFDMAVPVEFLEGIMTNVYEEGSGAEEEGKVCGDILGRLEGARDAGILTQEEFAAASRAVRALQWVFETAPEQNRQMHVLCSWAVLVPQPLVGMIEVGRGEALVILGYFFLALHYCRNAWLIGDSGEFLLKGLASHLGEEWKPWLESPMRILMDSLEANEMERQRRATSVNSQFTSSSLSPDVSMSVGSTPQYYPDNNNNR